MEKQVIGRVIKPLIIKINKYDLKNKYQNLKI